jgi:hypothetical protein
MNSLSKLGLKISGAVVMACLIFVKVFLVSGVHSIFYLSSVVYLLA